MSKKERVIHKWVIVGVTADPYCEDCNRPSNYTLHLQRCEHHIYVCQDCAKRRVEAVPIILG